MHKVNKKKLTLIIVLSAALLASLVLAINIGAVNINPKIIFSVIVNHMTGREIFQTTWDTSQDSIIWTIRFPRVLVAGMVGAGLALAGVFMQALTKNALADPYILGISSGASTGAVVSILIGTIPFIGKIYLPAGAFAGALLTSILVFVISGAGIKGRSANLVLVGMAISALFTALTDFIIFVNPDSKKLGSVLFWMTGSFASIEWMDCIPAVSALLGGIVVSIVINRELDAMLMGEELAKNSGVNTTLIKVIIIIASTLLTGIMVSMSGVIGFIGFVVPHVTRGLIGARHKNLLPVALLIGAIFMIWADVLSRTIIAPEELPVGIITAMVGAPFFIVMLRKNKYSFGK